MNRNFSTWLSGFRDSIADYGYYIDFEKVHRNVDNIKVELNILNYLIGSKNIEVDFENLMRKYPEVLKCIPLLLAVRANEIYCQDENGGHVFQFDFGKYPPNSHAHYERYKYFMRETGLFDLLENHIVNNLVDYATGVETGLDSNGRKNRGGHLMEDLVESFCINCNIDSTVFVCCCYFDFIDNDKNYIDYIDFVICVVRFIIYNYDAFAYDYQEDFCNLL